MKAEPKTTVGRETELAEGFGFDGEFLSRLEVLEMLAIVYLDFLLHYFVSLKFIDIIQINTFT